MASACPKCNGEMIQGTIESRVAVWTFKTEHQGVFASGQPIHKASACIACGYVELYLDASELKANR